SLFRFVYFVFFFFQAEDGIRDDLVTGVQTCALPICLHPRSLGEVGREGVAVDSLDDMETLFSGIPLGEVSTSMTINAPAAMLLAFYACVGEKQDVPIAALRGTVQTDILKEYIAQKEWIFPPVP